VISRYVHRRSVREETKEQAAAAEKPLGKEGGFALVFKDRYLLIIAILTVLVNVINTSGEFLLGKIVVQQAEATLPGAEMLAARGKMIGEFYGNYFGWTNLIGLLLQTFATSRILARIGVGGALLIGPGLSLAGYALVIVSPVLNVIRVFKMLDNSNDYSVQKTAMQALYLPTSREAKYKAKAAIDTFFVRMGDVTQAGIVYLGTALAFSVPIFAGLTLVLTCFWLAAALRVRGELRRKHVDSAA
jgi:AAA family ATP:ADP antiporter